MVWFDRLDQPKFVHLALSLHYMYNYTTDYSSVSTSHVLHGLSQKLFRTHTSIFGFRISV